MKNYKLYIVVYTLLSMLILSCDDVFEEDLTDDEVIPFFPLEGDEVLGNSVNFQWSFLDGADAYRIQVRSDNPNTGMLIDSLVTDNSLVVTIPSGGYSWSASGENFANFTPFFNPVNFDVVFSDNLEGQTIQLLTPSQNLFTNTVPIIYTWSPLEAATAYNFQLQRSLNGITTVFEENTATNTSSQPDASSYTEDAEYIWRVNANNENSQTNLTERSIFIDRTIPETPTLINPADLSAFSTDTISFSWSLATDTGNVQSERESIIEFSQTETFDILIDFFTIPSNTLDVTFDVTGTLFWRVRVDDLAGNSSSYSEVRRFTIN